MASKTKDTIHSFAEAAGITHTEARRLISALSMTVASALQRGDEIKIPAFDTLKPIVRKARVGRNPATGEAVDIPERKDVKFKPAPELKL